MRTNRHTPSLASFYGRVTPLRNVGLIQIIYAEGSVAYPRFYIDSTSLLIRIFGLYTYILPTDKGARGNMAAALFARGSAAQTYPTETLATQVKASSHQFYCSWRVGIVQNIRAKVE